MDYKLLKLFEGRTLEELDEMDVARLARALEAGSVSADVEKLQGWLDGSSTPHDVASVDEWVMKEYRRCLREERS